MDMQRGPPRPRLSSADGMTRQLMPFLYSTSLVTLLRWYTTTVPGRTHRVLEPSFHCSRSAAMRSPPPQGMSVTLRRRTRTARRKLLVALADLGAALAVRGDLEVGGPMMPGWMVNLSRSIWVNTVSRCMKARDTGMLKARMVSIGLVSSLKMLRAMASMASGSVRWEMPMASTCSLMFRMSPPSMWKVSLRLVVLGRAHEIRMVLEDVVAVDGLAVARLAVHAVDGHAVADHRERVAGEVQVRHRAQTSFERSDTMSTRRWVFSWGSSCRLMPAMVFMTMSLVPA